MRRHKLTVALAWRYSFSAHRSRLANLITLVCSAGLVLGVTMLTTVLSVMNGFDLEMRSRILQMVPHVRLEQSNPLPNWQDDLRKLKQLPGVAAVSPYTEVDVLIRYRDQLVPALIHGIAAEFELQQNPGGRLEGLPDSLSRSSIEQLHEQRGLILASGVADKLNVKPGALVTVLAYTGTDSRVVAQSYTLLEVLHTGTELDQRLVIADMSVLASLGEQRDQPHGLRVQAVDVFSSRQVGRAAALALERAYRVSTWERTHGNLYQAVQMSRYLVAMIVILVLAVATFNLVATLLIAAADKQGQMAILKTMGMPPRLLGQVFALQGLFIGSIGTLVGLILGSLLSLNITRIALSVERATGFKLLNTDVYPLDYLPSYWSLSQTLTVGLVAIGLSTLAALYPAWRVSRVEPAAVLRYN